MVAHVPVSAKSIIKQLESLRSDRHNWETHWQNIANLVLPSREFTTRQGKGLERRVQIYDSTAPQAASFLASALHGLLTNPALKWFSLIPIDSSMSLDNEALKWLEKSRDQMMTVFNSPASNFALASHEVYLDLSSFGTAILIIQSEKGIPRFVSKSLSDCFLKGDENDHIIGVWRATRFRVDELILRFGKENVDPETLKLFKRGEDQTEIEVVHAVFRRENADPLNFASHAKPWASVYVEVAQIHVLSEGGFDQNPYLTPRWEKAAGEIYGRSPAMTVLSDIRVINAMSRTILVAGELTIRPPMMIPANSIEGPIRTAPGSVNYYRSGSNDRPEPMMTGSDPRLGEALIAQRAERIERAFYTDMFRLPELDRMTATEVLERTRQRLQIMSPILSRLFAEFLTPVIHRTFNIMLESELFDPMPASLSGQVLDIDYQSPMAQAQQASEANNFVSFFAAATPLIQADPSILQNIDSDQTLRRLHKSFNVFAGTLRDSAEVTQARQQANDMAQAQQEAAIAKDAARAGRDAAAGVSDVAGVIGNIA